MTGRRVGTVAEGQVRGDELYLLPNHSVLVDVQHQATCFFFHTYDWVGTSSLVNGTFDSQTETSLAPLGEKALLAGISSVGKATLANLQNSRSLKVSARQDYVTALRLTNAAIRDGAQAIRDTTLSAVFLLSLFEVCARLDEYCRLSQVGLQSRLTTGYSISTAPQPSSKCVEAKLLPIQRP